MDAEFEELLREHRGVVERFVYYRLPSRADGDDVLQEVWLSAYRGFAALGDRARFKAWILGIARNKCADYFRACARRLEIPLDKAPARTLTASRLGLSLAVRDTLDELAENEKRILYLYYFKNKPQADIARALNVPLGTVKSRLHAAKRSFREKYPYPPNSKGDVIMGKLPKTLPEYRVAPTGKPPFSVKWEELMGWFLVPKQGESIEWAIYDLPERAMTETVEMRVTGRAEVHGIEGAAIEVKSDDGAERRFVAQLTDEHCRYLAESHMEDGVRKYHTFLDGEEFAEYWGFGEDNIGNETNISAKGDVVLDNGALKCADKPFLLDIIGRYTVEILGKSYDTVCVVDCDTHNPGMLTRQYIDENGRTVLRQRFNRDDWAYERYGEKWSEKLPENDRLTVNGATYVHWYDCISDYILR